MYPRTDYHLQKFDMEVDACRVISSWQSVTVCGSVVMDKSLSFVERLCVVVDCNDVGNILVVVVAGSAASSLARLVSVTLLHPGDHSA